MKAIRSIVATILILAISTLLLTGCGNNVKLLQFEPVADSATTAVIKTNMGDITVVLYGDEAPKAVANFIGLANEGKYNGVAFHRVINDFMIQGGDTDNLDGYGGQSLWGTPFEDEFSDKLWNFRGALSMANTGAPSSNGSQFFIVQAPVVDKELIAQMKSAGFPSNVIDKYKEVGGTPWLDKQHTVFGQVIDGMDVVDKIAAVPVDSSSKPLATDEYDAIIIESIEIK